MTTFFTELEKLINGCEKVQLVIQPKGDKLTVGFFPDKGKGKVTEDLRPLTLTGTASELDEGFLTQLATVMEKVNGLQSNLDQVEADAKKAEAEAKSEADKKKGAAAAKKVEKVKTATAKKTAKPEKKAEVKPEPAKVEAVQQTLC